MKVLVVDDSVVQRMIVSRTLMGAGHRVVEASNGLAALEKLRDEPDVIVCDILMPGLDGFGLLSVLARRGIRIPVVIVTADIHPSTRERCRALGATSFVAKPYSDIAILDSLESAVASSNTARM